MKKAFLLLSIMFLFFAADIFADETKIQWKSYKEGMELSKKTSKNIYIYFQTSWCKFCKQMKETTFSDKKIINYLNKNYISISVDGDKEKDIVRQFGIRGYPDSVFIVDGKKMHRPGYVPPKMLYLILSYVNTKSYLKMSFADFAKSSK